MDALLLSKGIFPEQYLRKTVDYILSVQLDSGNIPWFVDGKTDPWDHIEAAMGLTIAGEYSAAEKAYRWLAKQQLNDGSWWANYQGDEALYTDKRETNFIAYIATGVWHHYLVTNNKTFLAELFPVLTKAIDLVVKQQAPTGEIYWAINEQGEPLKDALVTACASVLKSIECAINCATVLGIAHDEWRQAYQKLRTTLHHHPECFDRTWESKARFSMDWFYPVLAGVYEGSAAVKRLDDRWSTFVEKELGCRCVSDEPWVTVAESCELTMALLAAGERAKAISLYGWLHQWRDSDGGYWTGYQMVEDVIWPEEKTTWTAGAILLAADAITEHTAASQLFIKPNLLAAGDTYSAAL